MRWSGLLWGVVTMFVGALWALQGMGVVGGSRMTGDPTWIWVGLAVIGLGMFLAYRGIRQLRRGRR